MRNDNFKKTGSAPSRQKTVKIKRFFFICLLVIIPLVLMELLSFAYIKLALNKGPYRNRLGQVSNPYHPYLGYVHAPHTTFNPAKGRSSLTTDENGYSITPSSSFADPDLTIIVTGGSTIFGVGSSDNSSTVPSILERLINQRLNIRCEVVNMALRGGQSFQEMLLINRFFSEKHADLVLAISGRNDADAALDDPTVGGAFLKKRIWNNAVQLVHQAERGEFIVIGIGNKLRSWSYTYDLLYRWLEPPKKSKKNKDLFQFNIRMNALTNKEQRAKISATHYAAADQISKLNDATFVMVLQPTAYTKNIYTEEEMRLLIRQRGSEKAINKARQGENEFYDAFRKIEKPFKFIDLSNIFSESKETLYIDQCHYNDLGAEKFAEKIFESIQPILLKNLNLSKE